MAQRSIGPRFLLGSLVALAAFIVVGYLMVGTGEGQRLDDMAFEGRKATDLGIRRAVTAVMRLGTPVGLVVLGVLMVADPVRRGRIRTGAVVAAVIVTVPVVARLLKDHLVRPELWELAWARHVNSFPSGHSAAWAALALMAVLTCGPRRRPAVAGLALTAVVLHNTAMLWSGWHRPSDVAAAMLLALVVVGPAAALLGRWGELEPVVGDVWYDDTIAVTVVSAAVTVVPTAAALYIRNAVPNPAHPLVNHLVALVAVNVAALAGVLFIARTVQRVNSVTPTDGNARP